MDRLGGHGQRNKSDRERQILYDITYMWTLKNTTNINKTITNRSRLTDMENKLVVASGEREKGRDNIGVEH